MSLKESWKPITNYEGLYEISNTGKVRRLYVTKPKRECKQFFRNDYPAVGLCKNNKVRSHSIHSLMAVAFIPNPENKKTVNHINGVKTDNRLENLEWATMSEQIIHANKIGIFKSIPPTKKGDKLSEETKCKMSIARTGKIISKEAREKISRSLRHYNQNKQHGK